MTKQHMLSKHLLNIQIGKKHLPLTVHPPPAAYRKAQLQLRSFTFCDVNGVSEWQTIHGQWPGQTVAAALVPAGHTQLYSSLLISLSLKLYALWRAKKTHAAACF